MDMLYLEVVVNHDEDACIFEGLKERVLDLHVSCVVNSCQEMIAGFLFWLNYSLRPRALALDVIQVLDGRNYFQSC